MHDRLACCYDLPGISKRLDDGSVRVCDEKRVEGFVFSHFGVGFCCRELSRRGIQRRFCLFISLWSGCQTIFYQRCIAFLVRLRLDQNGACCRNGVAPGCQRQLKIGFINAHECLAFADLLPHIDHPLDDLARNTETKVALDTGRDRSCERALSHSGISGLCDPNQGGGCPRINSHRFLPRRFVEHEKGSASASGCHEADDRQDVFAFHFCVLFLTSDPNELDCDLTLFMI
ncbi:hypothetical protein D3C71_1052700 [compost metagenome]